MELKSCADKNVELKIAIGTVLYIASCLLWAAQVESLKPLSNVEASSKDERSLSLYDGPICQSLLEFYSFG